MCFVNACRLYCMMLFMHGVFLFLSVTFANSTVLIVILYNSTVFCKTWLKAKEGFPHFIYAFYCLPKSSAAFTFNCYQTLTLRIPIFKAQLTSKMFENGDKIRKGLISRQHLNEENVVGENQIYWRQDVNESFYHNKPIAASLPIFEIANTLKCHV